MEYIRYYIHIIQQFLASLTGNFFLEKPCRKSYRDFVEVLGYMPGRSKLANPKTGRFDLKRPEHELSMRGNPSSVRSC